MLDISVLGVHDRRTLGHVILWVKGFHHRDMISYTLNRRMPDTVLMSSEHNLVTYKWFVRLRL
jgi:hypothetical protein